MILALCNNFLLKFNFEICIRNQRVSFYRTQRQYHKTVKGFPYYCKNEDFYCISCCHPSRYNSTRWKCRAVVLWILKQTFWWWKRKG